MALPTESEILSQVNALKNYSSLFINGRLSEEARAVISGGSGSSGGGGGTPDVTPLLIKIKSASDYHLEITYLDLDTLTQRIGSVEYSSQLIGFKIIDTLNYISTESSDPYKFQSTSRTVATYP